FVQFGFGLAHVIFGVAEMTGRLGNFLVGSFLLQIAGLGAELLLFGSQLRSFGGIGLGRFFDGIHLHRLLLLDDFLDFVLEFFEAGQLFLGFFELGDLLAELLIGALQRIDGGLLGGGVILGVGE